MNEQKPNSWLSKLATPSVLLALATAIIWLATEVKKIPTIDQRLGKKISILNEIHEDLDVFKIEVIERLNDLELDVKDEKIERLEREIEYLKNNN